MRHRTPYFRRALTPFGRHAALAAAGAALVLAFVLAAGLDAGFAGTLP